MYLKTFLDNNNCISPYVIFTTNNNTIIRNDSWMVYLSSRTSKMLLNTKERKLLVWFRTRSVLISKVMQVKVPPAMTDVLVSNVPFVLTVCFIPHVLQKCLLQYFLPCALWLKLDFPTSITSNMKLFFP